MGLHTFGAVSTLLVLQPVKWKSVMDLFMSTKTTRGKAHWIARKKHRSTGIKK